MVNEGEEPVVALEQSQSWFAHLHVLRVEALLSECEQFLPNWARLLIGCPRVSGGDEILRVPAAQNSIYLFLDSSERRLLPTILAPGVLKLFLQLLQLMHPFVGFPGQSFFRALNNCKLKMTSTVRFIQKTSFLVR